MTVGAESSTLGQLHGLWVQTFRPSEEDGNGMGAGMRRVDAIRPVLVGGRKWQRCHTWRAVTLFLALLSASGCAATVGTCLTHRDCVNPEVCGLEGRCEAFAAPADAIFASSARRFATRQWLSVPERENRDVMVLGGEEGSHAVLRFDALPSDDRLLRAHLVFHRVGHRTHATDPTVLRVCSVIPSWFGSWAGGTRWQTDPARCVSQTVNSEASAVIRLEVTRVVSGIADGTVSLGVSQVTSRSMPLRVASANHAQYAMQPKLELLIH